MTVQDLRSSIRGARTAVLSIARRMNRTWLRKQTRLHVGCGNLRLPGYLNIDASRYARGADIVCRLSRLERLYPHDNAEIIYACHVLEHLSHAEADEMLGVFYGLLKPGGELRVSVPDMDRVVRIYTENWEHFQTPGNSPWTGLIWGGQSTPYDFHKTGFNFCWMKFLMEKHGFRDIQEYPHEPHFLGAVDGSLANEPFGEFISLNVMAYK